MFVIDYYQIEDFVTLSHELNLTSDINDIPSFSMDIKTFTLLPIDKYNKNKLNLSIVNILSTGLLGAIVMGMAAEENGSKKLGNTIIFGPIFVFTLLTMPVGYNYTLLENDNNNLYIFGNTRMDWYMFRNNKWLQWNPRLGVRYYYKSLKLETGYNYNIDYALGDWHKKDGLFFSIGWGFGNTEKAKEQANIDEKNASRIIRFKNLFRKKEEKVELDNVYLMSVGTPEHKDNMIGATKNTGQNYVDAFNNKKDGINRSVGSIKNSFPFLDLKNIFNRENLSPGEHKAKDYDYIEEEANRVMKNWEKE